jgi:hypothetical protein
MRVEGGSGGRTVARQQKQGRFVRREGEKERGGETGLNSILLGLEKRVKRWWRRWWWRRRWWWWWWRSTTEAVWTMEV